MLKVVLLFIFSLSLFAQSNYWYSRVDAKMEAGIYLPQLGGTIENIVGTSDFSQDFAYADAKASYFSVELRHDYDYVPNLYISYFNMQDNKSATLTKKVQIADQIFDSNTSTLSTIGYQVFDTTLYQDLRIKGQPFPLFGRNYYSGDLEFDVGLSTKLFMWQYEVQDLTNLSRASSWIHVNEFIPLPYIGIKYFLYDLRIYANVSDLAFSKAKSNSYQAGIDYRVVSGLSLSASYLYEQFKVAEKHDTVEFTTTGLKFSFKYAF